MSPTTTMIDRLVRAVAAAVVLLSVLADVGHAQECAGNFTVGENVTLYDCPSESTCYMTGDFFPTTYGGSVQNDFTSITAKGSVVIDCRGNETCSYDCCEDGSGCKYTGTLPSGATSSMAMFAAAAVTVVMSVIAAATELVM